MTDLPVQALAHSVQEFPPPDNTGLLFTQLTRGPILPPYGTKERDRILRIIHRNEYNGIWQGAVAGLIKRIKSTKWEIRGDVKEAEYFQDLFQDAQFGQGWGTLISRTLEDYLCQDYGAFWELIGRGHPSGPLLGPVEGVAHLDAGRTYVTGNPLYPVLYYSLMTGRMHKIHHSRLVRIVDMPNPDERYFGIGLSALSRAVAVTQREMRMGQYIDQLLDDKPKPGIALVQGMTGPQRMAAIDTYNREQQSDERPVWGKVLWMHSINIDLPIDIKTIPFTEAPEKFDFIKYTELDVNAVALALGVDRQELWELQGKSSGSNAQSQVLAQKSQGKAYADMLNSIERIINVCILPEALEFRFKFKDPFADKSQAQIDAMYMQIAQGMASIPGVFSGNEIRRFLANKSISYEDVLTNRGGVALPDDDLIPAPQQTSLTDNPPPGANDQAPSQQATAATTNQNERTPAQQKQPAPVTQPKKKLPTGEQKSFWLTSFDWTEKFMSYVNGAQKGLYTNRQLYVLLLSELEDWGEKAFADGLIEGGVSDPLDTDEKALVQAWLSSQTPYLTRFVDEVYGVGIADVKDRAQLWANKSLREIYYAGKRSADKNGMYEWSLGRTEVHCRDCSRLNGQRHRLKEYYRRGWIPGNPRLECKGYRCDCSLRKTNAPAQGRF